MKTSSAKAKGRRLQQRVRDDLRAVAGTRLDPTDIESTPMGCNGVDVILTKAARDLFGPLAIECKNVEKLNAVRVFQEHLERYAPQGKIALMVHSRNHVEPRITLLWTDFVKLFLSPAIGRDPAALRPPLDALRAKDAANQEDYRGPRRTVKPSALAAPFANTYGLEAPEEWEYKG